MPFAPSSVLAPSLFIYLHSWRSNQDWHRFRPMANWDFSWRSCKLLAGMSASQRKFSVQNFRVADIQQLFNTAPIIHHSSYTTHHTPLIIHHSSYTTHHTPLIIHHSSYTTHHAPLIIHHSSYTTHHTPLIIHHSSYTTYHTPLIIHHSSYTTHHALLIIQLGLV